MFSLYKDTTMPTSYHCNWYDMKGTRAFSVRFEYAAASENVSRSATSTEWRTVPK